MAASRGGERERIYHLSLALKPQINQLVVSRHLRVLLANSEFSNLAPMIARLLFSIDVLTFSENRSRDGCPVVKKPSNFSLNVQEGECNSKGISRKVSERGGYMK